jgi:hypothetical protein
MGLAEMQFSILQQQYGKVDKVDESTYLKGNMKVFRRYGMYYIENTSVGFLNAIFIDGKDAWFISCEAQNGSTSEFLQYQGLFQRIVDSFERVK